MTETIQRREKRSFSEQEVQRALVEIAAASGNTRKASRELALEGLEIHSKTLWRWYKETHAEKYERIRLEMLPKITAFAAEQHMALARQQMELTAAAAALVADRLHTMDDRDLVNAMGKADIGSGIHTEKAQLLAGAPTQIVRRTSAEVIRELQSMGIEPDEIEAEVVSEEDVKETNA
jgi:hypothetical protein